MKRSKFLSMVALFSASAAFAQGPGGPGRMGPMGGGGFGMQQHERKLVAGAPYSADVTASSVRTLTDSNTIQHSTTGHVARDSQGRTYSTETVSGGMMGEAGPKTITFISDPVAGYSYMLDSTKKIAVKRAIHARPANAEAPTHTRPANPNSVSTDLSAQVINGVSATGKQTTRTVPAGTVGNALPLVSTSESWYSTDLQIVVSSKRSDPQGGVSTYNLTNIQRAEPPATLFQVPADYTVKDAGRPGGRHEK